MDIFWSGLLGFAWEAKPVASCPWVLGRSRLREKVAGSMVLVRWDLDLDTEQECTGLDRMG